MVNEPVWMQVWRQLQTADEAPGIIPAICIHTCQADVWGCLPLLSHAAYRSGL